MREGRIGSDRERIATLEGEVREGKWRREGGRRGMAKRRPNSI